MPDYKDTATSPLDHPSIVKVLFHPRPDRSRSEATAATRNHQILVDEDTHIGARFHLATDKSSPAILFFHGNGEIVADYDELAPYYTNLGLHFLVVDYRGYGTSNGSPSVAAMLSDSYTLFDFVRQWLKSNNFDGPLIVMGRSLGSVSALEMASSRKTEIDGLIIESGLAYTLPLIRLLGIAPEKLGLSEEQGFGNLQKISSYQGPTLILHAEFDHIIPFSDGRALFDASTSPRKTLVMIPGANHNDIMFRGGVDYMTAIERLAYGGMET